MVDLVTIEQARAHLRLDSDGADDDWLAIFIPAVSEAVALWLKDPWRLYEWQMDTNGDPAVDSHGDPVPQFDTNGDPVVRFVVKAAVLVELGSQFRFREGEGKDNVNPSDAGHGYVLNKASTALLAPLRKTTVATGGFLDSLEGTARGWRRGFKGCCS